MHAGKKTRRCKFKIKQRKPLTKLALILGMNKKWLSLVKVRLILSSMWLLLYHLNVPEHHRAMKMVCPFGSNIVWLNAAFPAGWIALVLICYCFFQLACCSDTHASYLSLPVSAAAQWLWLSWAFCWKGGGERESGPHKLIGFCHLLNTAAHNIRTTIHIGVKET